MAIEESVPLLDRQHFNRSDVYREEVHKYIVGGAHTYSKGDDQFPVLAPAAIARGKGGRVWDLDGNDYVDCSLGLGAVSLGHAYEPVLDAVRKQLELGVAFQRPAAIELEFAREFIDAVPGAERVKFAKNGSTVTTAAIKLARAYTGREKVAFPGNHSFYSYDDWFIGKTLCNSGVPAAIQNLSLHYDSTRPETLDQLFLEHPNQIACVITEPEEIIPHDPEMLRQVAQITKDNKAVFVLDEMVSGYRAGWPAAYVKMGVSADLITWGKAVGNGFSFCALTGRAEIMDLGGIKANSAPRVFLISTTHGGEAHGIAAAQAVLREYQQKNVLQRHSQLVTAVAQGMKKAVADFELDGKVGIYESAWRVVCVCRDKEGNVSMALRTLLLQEMIRRGALFQGLFLPCYSHTDADVEQLLEAFSGSCAVYRRALEEGTEGLLVGHITPPVFRKYNNCKQICASVPCPHEAECRTEAPNPQTV